MRGSPGKVTAALMQAATTEAERIEDAKAKDDKDAKKDELEAKKNAKKDELEAKKNANDSPGQVVLVVGDIVITSVKKYKARFDSFKAQVVSIKKDKVRVKFMEGPADGVAKDLPRSGVSLFVDDADAEEDSGDQKRQKLADELFGATL
jgi:sRNA-binding protein